MINEKDVQTVYEELSNYVNEIETTIDVNDIMEAALHVMADGIVATCINTDEAIDTYSKFLKNLCDNHELHDLEKF